MWVSYFHWAAVPEMTQYIYILIVQIIFKMNMNLKFP